MKLIFLRSWFCGFLLTWGITGFAQIGDCKVTLLKMQTESPCSRLIVPNVLISNNNGRTDSMLLRHSDILKMRIQVDTASYSYGSRVYKTTHVFTITDEAAKKLNAIPIPLSSGIPVSLRIDGVEIYRAFMWNPLSSFACHSITITQFGNTLIVTN
jgi:hypothetical protein